MTGKAAPEDAYSPTGRGAFALYMSFQRTKGVLPLSDASFIGPVGGQFLPRAGKRENAWVWGALLLVLASGWALRAWILFGSPLLPGLNGAYYPVQARAILHTGLLGIPDFPLLFYFQAGIGAILSLFLPSGTAIINAVRLTDTILPVLLAVPAYLFVRSFDGGRQRGMVIALATLVVGIIAVGNGSLMRMAGDFQKNAAALPLYLAFVYFLHRSFRDSRRRDYILTFLFFSLTCLTHIGVAALAMTTAVFAGIAGLMSTLSRRRALIMVSLLAAALLLAMVFVSLFDIHRVTKLFSVALSPTRLFADSPIRFWLGIQAGPSMPFAGESVSLGVILGLLGVMAAVYHPGKLESADRAILWAASLSALLFALPIFGREWSQRLSLMSFAPGLTPLAFLAVRVRWGLVVSGVVMTLVVLTSARDLPGISYQRITVPAYNELAAMRSSLPEGKNLVIARHGLEWWAAWTMNVKIANNVATVLDAWDTYDAVWYLEEINSGAFTTGDMRRPGGLPGGGAPASGFMGSQGPPPGNRVDGATDRPDGKGASGLSEGPAGPDAKAAANAPGAPFGPNGAGGPRPDGLPGPNTVGPIGPAGSGAGGIGRIELSSEILEPVRKGTWFQLSRIPAKPEGEMYGENSRHRR